MYHNKTRNRAYNALVWLNTHQFVSVCLCLCVRARVYEWECLCVCVCVSVCTWTNEQRMYTWRYRWDEILLSNNENNRTKCVRKSVCPLWMYSWLLPSHRLFIIIIIGYHLSIIIMDKNSILFHLRRCKQIEPNWIRSSLLQLILIDMKTSGFFSWKEEIFWKKKFITHGKCF